MELSVTEIDTPAGTAIVAFPVDHLDAGNVSDRIVPSGLILADANA